jgi:hypothetical protein
LRHPRKKALDFRLVLLDVSTAWFRTAFSTVWIISGVDGATFRASIVFFNFGKPSLPANCLDPRQVVPKLQAMGSFGLKLLQIIAGIRFAFGAKRDPFFGGASGYLTYLTIRPSFRRATSIAPNCFFTKLKLGGQLRKPSRVFCGRNVCGTSATVEATHGGQVLRYVFARHRYAPSLFGIMLA